MWTDALDAMGLTYGYPQGAYYVYVNVGSTGLTGAAFARRLREDHRVIIGSGGSIGSEWERYVRGSLAVPSETLREGLARVADAVARSRKAPV
jgi:aspartate/methionine/tyrosine aminotransferase